MELFFKSKSVLAFLLFVIEPILLSLFNLIPPLPIMPEFSIEPIVLLSRLIPFSIVPLFKILLM
ncbi:hypothetical protein [Campylobacter armoricus]|uniref:hypothetical protein n=1 Tax=Campylobacter armoricus TaxID=2505970 RepID=UPI0015949FC3|nr:hypothetical protein [Campylobacter armoricus]